MKLKKEDLILIGHTFSQTMNGHLSVITDRRSDSILLREVLKLFGPEYIIAYQDDFQWRNGVCDWEMITNLPFEIFESLAKKVRGRMWSIL